MGEITLPKFTCKSDIVNMYLKYKQFKQSDKDSLKSTSFHSICSRIIDHEAAISMAKCNKDTAGNRHVARRYYYVQQGTASQEQKFEWIGTKFQLADPLTKPGSVTSFMELWKCILHDCEE